MWHNKFRKQEVFFTSDLHLMHRNMAKGVSRWSDGYRNFKNEIEMSETIVKNINDKVPHDAMLFHLGDFFFGQIYNFEYWRNKINCKNIVNIYGNHDKQLRKCKRLQSNFTWCGDYLEIYVESQFISMFHYGHPAVFNKSHRGAWFLYGHSHGSLEDNNKTRTLEVGIDTSLKNICKDLVPYTFDELAGLMNKKQVSSFDHHIGE